jgi:hypothetical protein
MKHSKNNNAIGINREENLVGELSRECAPGALIDDLKRLGITNDGIEQTINCADKL